MSEYIWGIFIVIVVIGFSIAGAATILQIAEEAKVLDDDIIRSLDNPYFKQGGIAVLKGLKLLFQLQ